MIAKIDTSIIFLETERLLIRPFIKDDLQDFYEYAKVEGVGQMAGWTPHKNIKESEEILNIFIISKKQLAIIYKENNKCIGSIGIESFNDQDLLSSSLLGREIGYVLSKDYWGQGLMCEACKCVIDYCFNILNYDFFLCGYFIWNNQSKRVNEKLGFKFYKEILYKTRSDVIEKTNLNILYKNAK